jgi:hypothetical protein
LPVGDSEGDAQCLLGPKSPNQELFTSMGFTVRIEILAALGVLWIGEGVGMPGWHREVMLECVVR